MMTAMKTSARPRIAKPVTPPSARFAEKIPTTIYTSSAEASAAVAAEIAELIRSKADAGEQCVLGLATGSTPIAMYKELARLHRDEGLSFENVITFNLDEYFPMKPSDLQSYVRFMKEQLFNHIDVAPENIHIPNGTLPLEAIFDWCQEYEAMIRQAGGIDFQVLGIGRTGHVGFNEPGSPRESKTRMITLDHVTRSDAAGDFFGLENVPRKAVTMGVDTIMNARRIVLMAFGEHKASTVRKAVEGEVTSQVSSSFLQLHTNAEIVLDPSAAGNLTRSATPWLIGSMSEFGLAWDDFQTRRAATWLAQECKKPLLKLTSEDYNEHGLQELIAARGGPYEINIEVFKSLMNTITGWPGGKPKNRADEPQPVHHSSDAFPKRVIVFSPHPDDDVISMGGTFIRLCEQGHNVHVAYQTSGNIAVFDDVALRHADFVGEYCKAFKLLGEGHAQRIEEHIEQAVRQKDANASDSPELRTVKGLIRRSEARAAAKFSGVKEENIHFLDLPFYETGRVRKNPLGEADIQIVFDLLQAVKPHQIYAAGDLSRPARHAPRLPRSHLRRDGSAQGRSVDEGVRHLALPRRVARVPRPRNRDGRPAFAG